MTNSNPRYSNGNTRSTTKLGSSPLNWSIVLKSSILSHYISACYGYLYIAIYLVRIAATIQTLLKHVVYPFKPQNGPQFISIEGLVLRKLRHDQSMTEAGPKLLTFGSVPELRNKLLGMYYPCHLATCYCSFIWFLLLFQTELKSLVIFLCLLQNFPFTYFFLFNLRSS